MCDSCGLGEPAVTLVGERSNPTVSPANHKLYTFRRKTEHSLFGVRGISPYHCKQTMGKLKLFTETNE